MNFKLKNDNINLDQLVGKLHKEDNRYAKLCRVLQIVYWIFIPFFTLMAIRHYMDSGDINDLIGGLLYVVGFLIIAIFFGNYHKEYKYVDYSLPTLKMLKDAAYRYQAVQLKSLWILLAVLFIYAGLIFESKLDDSFIKEQAFLLGGVLLGLFIGLIVWYFKYKPLRDNALRLIAEIEGE
jgi:hypothetical protein